MNSKIARRAYGLLALVSVIVVGISDALAGPPLICHAYSIGSAKSLPGGSDRYGTDSSYDRGHLVADTLDLLATDTPILERMETLRRAAIYATGNLRTWDGEKYTNIDKVLGAELTAKLRERTTTGSADARALALFDLGFFTETLRQTGLDPALDGYEILAKAAELLKGRPEVEFALALASIRPKRAEHAGHLARARADAVPGSLLALNLETHFGKS
jgi:hypothetical protein